MLQRQYPYIDENGNKRGDLIKHYSDSGKYIRQVETGIEYAVAIDSISREQILAILAGATIDSITLRYTYVETDKPIEVDEVTQKIAEATKKVTDELTDAVNALNVLGVS